MMTFTVVVIMSALASVAALTPITNANINKAVALWKSDQSNCTATYGHISFWDTGSVTNMDELFYQESTRVNRDHLFCGEDPRRDAPPGYKCSPPIADFNEDISQWNVGNVKSMKYVSMRARLSSAHRST